MAFDRNVLNVRAWQQHVMDLNDRVDSLGRKSVMLVKVVEFLEKRAIGFKLEIDEQSAGSPTYVKLAESYAVTIKNLAHYSSESEECAIQVVVSTETFESERDACAVCLKAQHLMQYEAEHAQDAE